MENSIILSNVTREQLFDTFRGIVREELAQSAPKKDETRYLSRKEASKLLHISLPTLNEYTQKGIIKGSRIGTRVLYLEADIQEAVKNIPSTKYRRVK
jgi:excisionase family DNA binding protein